MIGYDAGNGFRRGFLVAAAGRMDEAPVSVDGPSSVDQLVE